MHRGQIRACIKARHRFILKFVTGRKGLSFSSMDTNRRFFLLQLGAATAGVRVSSIFAMPGKPQTMSLPGAKRPATQDRNFHSDVVEAYIQSITHLIPSPTLSELFANCFPNTLDTTVRPGTFEGKPDTAVLTGDIAAMWLRDSSAQVWPYLPLAQKDRGLRRLLEGVIRRQVRCILIDPYANCFMADLDAPPLEGSRADKTEMKRGVGERKYELDSLCYPIRLAHGYWKSTGDTAPFDAAWKLAMQTVIKTMRTEQRKYTESPYRFQRAALNPTDSLVNGVGEPLRPVGLIASAFRPSDDACSLPFLIPANLFAVTSLRQLATMASTILHDAKMASEALTLASEVEEALRRHAVIPTAEGTIWAYEIDGYGSTILMDDANAPSLLSLPYLNSSSDAALYARTRSFVWSERNPWFFRGSVGEGIGGPHIGRDSIWPMSQILYALTSESPSEIRTMIKMLERCSVSTGFVHESYNKDDSTQFTRAWFAWANTLFGELIARTATKDASLLA